MNISINVDTLAQQLGINRDKLEQWKMENLANQPSDSMNRSVNSSLVAAHNCSRTKIDSGSVEADRLCSSR